MKRSILFGSLALVVIFSATPITFAGERGMSILQIFDQFVMASKAASKCINPEKEILRSFLKNFRAVWKRAAEEIQTKKPEWPEKEVAAAMKMRSEDLGKKVEAVVGEKGCIDQRIKDLLKRFEVQARLRFG